MAKQKYPEPTVGALIFNKEGKIFLMKSPKWKNKYVIPGGHVEMGETLKQAIEREIKEETGLNIFDIEFVYFQEFIYGNAFWKKRHFMFFDFSCRTNSTKVKPNKEVSEYRWATLKEALKLPIEPYTRKSIQEYLKMKKKLKKNKN